MPAPTGHPHADYPGAGRSLDPLRVIAVFKFLKAVLLIATGYGVHLLLNEALLQRLRDWTYSITDSLAQRLLLHALTWVEGLGAKRIHLVMAVTLGYTAVVLCEGIGLWMRRAWAEWLTVVATACLIPIELWELITRPSSRKLAPLVTLIVSVAIVWYLTWLLRRSAQARVKASALDIHTSRRSTG
jgi:uncharacterized membrane protein (DUF2068 family)